MWFFLNNEVSQKELATHAKALEVVRYSHIRDDQMPSQLTEVELQHFQGF